MPEWPEMQSTADPIPRHDSFPSSYWSPEATKMYRASIHVPFLGQDYFVASCMTTWICLSGSSHLALPSTKLTTPSKTSSCYTLSFRMNEHFMNGYTVVVITMRTLLPTRSGPHCRLPSIRPRWSSWQTRSRRCTQGTRCWVWKS